MVEFLDKVGLESMERYTGIIVLMSDHVRSEAEAFLLSIGRGKPNEGSRGRWSCKRYMHEKRGIDVFIPQPEELKESFLG
ncbi:MAG: hypothetical protein QXW82_07965 [Candidatus Bathyarchaeia archaeon]